jgi:signal transduction histidine kinase
MTAGTTTSDIANGPVPEWAMPGELAHAGRRRRRRRTVRDWLVDAALFGFAALWWWWGFVGFVLQPDPDYLAMVPDWMVAIDPWAGTAACLSLWWRRRFPLAIAIAMVPVLAVSATATGAVLISIFTLAVHRGWLPATLVTAVQLGQAVAFSLVYHPPELPPMVFTTYMAAMFVAPLGWGMGVRFRRQLLLSLRRDAWREREEQQRRLEEARSAERARIAREMHDVLAHRMSLLSVHAGALAYRIRQAEAGAAGPLAATEVAEAVRVIRDNAHEALVELGEVLTVLRAGEPGDDVTGRRPPQPMLADLPRLVEEARAAGQPVTFEIGQGLSGAESLRQVEQRTVYRVVQEGLTNARKHAPEAPVTVRVDGTPGDGVRVAVTNPLPGGADGGIPGAGAGLVGLSERVSLDGGELHHGVADGEFRLSARLPWQP